MDTTQFLERVRQHAQLPTDDEDFPTGQILVEATQALYERYAQALAVLRNGYWLHRKVFSSSVGQNFYRIPSRAIVQGLEKLEVSTGGNAWRQLSILTDPQATDFDNRSGQGYPGWFSLESDGVILYPTPSSSTYPIRMSFYLRPSVLIETLTVGVVTAVTPTLVTVQGDVSTTLVTGAMDFVNNTGCNEVIVMDQPVGAITSIGGGLWTVATTGLDTSRIVAGNLVRPADQTDQIPLPIELHGSLCDWTVSVILAAKGDFDKAQQFISKAETAIKRIVDQATPRVKARPYVLKTRNTLLRRKLGRGCW